MAEEMVRASGGFSRQDLRDAHDTGVNEGKAAAKSGNDAEVGHVLYGKKFTTYDAINAEGRMPNRGRTDIQLASRFSTQMIPAGYHNGQGVVYVADPSGTRRLDADDIVLDLTPYDFKYVDATDVYKAGKSAGVISVLKTVTVDLNQNESISEQIINRSGFPQSVVIVASLARPRGDGYSTPRITASNATLVSHTTAQHSSEARQTNVAMATDVYTLGTGQTMQYGVFADNKPGVLSLMVLTKGV